MPGMVDAISSASIRLEKVAARLADVVFDRDASGHLQAADESVARDAVRLAIRELEQTIDALVKALAEEPTDASPRT